MKKSIFTIMALLISFGSMAQTLPKYNGKIYTYTKKGDIEVQVNDPQKTKLYFKGYTSMPTAAQVFTEYKRVLALPPVVVPSNFISVGNGSGYLEIDGKTLSLTTTRLIKINAGSYKAIYIKNLTGTSSSPIVIKNSGKVSISEGMETDNVKYLTISGDGDSGLPFGILFENIKFRAIKTFNGMSGLVLNKLSFKNVGDYCIAGERSNGNDLNYLGTAETRTEGFKILNCLFENAGPIVFGGNLNKDTKEDNGLFKDVEIAYNTFKNSSPGSAVTFTNVQDYDIHHNIVDNLNKDNNNHNGVFYMQGNGKFHDNKLTNYQGNSIRMWLYSRGNTPATNEIYNNICYTTRKYSGFELQGFDRNMYSGKTTFANARVYNNTVGTMNTNRDWEGQLLDLYNYGGTLEYFNNLGFDLYYSGKDIKNMINNMSDVKIIKEENNKYFPTWDKAVKDLTTFESLFPGVGASIQNK